MTRRLLTFVLFMTLLPALAMAVEPGTTPVSALDWDGAERLETVRTSHYYSYAAPEDGILTLTLTPLRGGEVDLTMVHYSGSPAFESRREGAAPEEIAIKVTRGDRFLLRVISPFGRPADYRLSAVLSGGSFARRAEQFEAPALTTDGQATASAIRIPIGVLVPVEATGARYFSVMAPAGYLLAVRLIPVSDNVDLELLLRNDSAVARSASMRAGFLAEEAYLIPSTTGEALIRVLPVVSRPGGGPLRYALIAQIRQPGVSSLKPVSEPLWGRIAIEAFDSQERGPGIPGVPVAGGWDLEKTSSRVLRLP